MQAYLDASNTNVVVRLYLQDATWKWVAMSPTSVLSPRSWATLTPGGASFDHTADPKHRAAGHDSRQHRQLHGQPLCRRCALVAAGIQQHQPACPGGAESSGHARVTESVLSLPDSQGMPRLAPNPHRSSSLGKKSRAQQKGGRRNIAWVRTISAIRASSGGWGFEAPPRPEERSASWIDRRGRTPRRGELGRFDFLNRKEQLMHRPRHLLLALCAGLCLLAGSSGARADVANWHQGMTFCVVVARCLFEVIHDHFAQSARQLKGNWIAIVPHWHMSNRSSTTIYAENGERHRVG